MKSSATSTDAASGFRPWHFFVVGALLAASVGVILSPGAGPAHLVLMSLAVGAAALAGLALHRTLGPLAVRGGGPEQVETVGRRTRAALEREKMLVLRSIKELEFDRAMGKVSEQDFHDMAARLRGRAIGLMKQLDGDTSEYRELIERELRARLQATVAQGLSPASRQSTVAVDGPQSVHSLQSPAPGAYNARPVCARCGTANDRDARFCKSCGSPLVNEA